MRFLDFLFDLPDRLTHGQLAGALALVALTSPFLTPFTCRVGAKIIEPSVVPIDFELRRETRLPDFLVRLPRDRAGADPDSLAHITIEECPTVDSVPGRVVWRLDEKADRDGWLRRGERWSLFEPPPFHLLAYGEVPFGWEEVHPAGPLEDGVPYVIRLDLDRRFGGRAFFVREGRVLRFGSFLSPATTKQSCDWFARAEGVWRRA